MIGAPASDPLSDERHEVQAVAAFTVSVSAGAHQLVSRDYVHEYMWHVRYRMSSASRKVSADQQLALAQLENGIVNKGRVESTLGLRARLSQEDKDLALEYQIQQVFIELMKRQVVKPATGICCKVNGHDASRRVIRVAEDALAELKTKAASTDGCSDYANLLKGTVMTSSDMARLTLNWSCDDGVLACGEVRISKFEEAPGACANGSGVLEFAKSFQGGSCCMTA